MLKQQIIATFIGMGLIVSPISISDCYNMSSNNANVLPNKVEIVSDTLLHGNNNVILANMNIEINALDTTDRQSWYLSYKEIQSRYGQIDESKSIHSVATSSEFDLISRVVEAEIGGGDFNAKCNVASTIINRWRFYAPRTWSSVLYEKDQYTPMFDGRANKAIASDETKLAIEYVFEIGDTTNGAIYFHSGRSRWHERATKIERTVTDQWHKFYKLR